MVAGWQARRRRGAVAGRPRVPMRGDPARPTGAASLANLLFEPLPKRVKLCACARRKRLWDSSHALEPGDMYTSIVFVYTTASVFSNPARGPTVFTGVAAS
jgi:hypothetical protein